MKRKTMLAIFTAAFTGLLLFIGCKQQEPDIYYTVTFNSDGGSYVSSQIVQSGSMATKPTDPTRDGYYFRYWYIEDGYWFDFNTSITRDITLTAEWSKWEYTVTFNFLNGEYEYQHVEHGNTIREPEPPTQEGYTFEGWYTEDGIPFDFDTPITRNIRLHAGLSITVTFDSNGGSPVSTQYVEYGNTAERPEEPVKEGHTFQGWYTEDGITFDFSYTPITSSITLTAYWNKWSCTVTFDSNGGSPVSTQDVEYGNTAERPEPPVKEGCTFEGWYTKDGILFNFDTPITSSISSITLTAYWSKWSYTVTFDSNGGSPVSTQYVEYGNRVWEPEPPNQEGHTFEGWYTEDGITFDFLTPITSDITLTAYWSRRSYTVTFDSNGGSPVSTQYVEYGNRAERPEEPVKEGHYFEGWYTEDGSYFEFSYTSITSSITLTAYWSKYSRQVKFHSKGGSPVSTQSVEYGNTVREPEPPTQEGYTFEGWYTEDGIPFDFDTPITSEITLYAQWTKIADTPSNDGRPAGSKDLTTNERLNGTWKLTDGYGYRNNPLFGLEECKTMDALAELFNEMVYDYYHDSNSEYDKSWSFFDANFCRAITSVEAKGLFTYLKNQIAAMQSYGDGWIVINNDETRIDIFLHMKSGYTTEIQFTLEKQ